MTTYRERLTAPLSWWMAAVGFALVWGWVFFVVTTPLITTVVTVLLVVVGFYAVWRYGSVLIEVGPDGLRVGQASVGPEHVGGAVALDRAAYRTQLGTGADARAHLFTRPYLDHGVVVTIDDPSDPAPYWLVSSRDPDAFAAALTGRTSRQTNGDPRGEEA